MSNGKSSVFVLKAAQVVCGYIFIRYNCLERWPVKVGTDKDPASRPPDPRYSKLHFIL